MAQLIAVPVGQGDAFYFESNGWSVLVDGGRSRSGFASAFQRETQVKGVSVVVCTHNDADHANGILGFLEAGFRCEEVWLPGSWLGALPRVLRPFVEVFTELADEVARGDVSQSRQEGISSIEAYANQLCESPNEGLTNDEEPLVGEGGWPKSYVEMLEQAETWEIAPRAMLWPLEDWPFFRYLNYQRLTPAEIQLLWSAINAAGRIRAIAIEAFHRGISVRWFEFGGTKPSGGVPSLQPVNARAVARVRAWVGPLLTLLALTVSNKESLVFWSPRTNQHPGVLFTADSDLSGVRLPNQLNDAIATAPHHGSEANAKAYAVVATAAQQHSPSIMWVRSDGRYRCRPGPTYLSLLSRRFCTLCRSVSFPKQPVHFLAQGGLWTPQNTLPCQCR